jgi:hypothetical protein
MCQSRNPFLVLKSGGHTLCRVPMVFGETVLRRRYLRISRMYLLLVSRPDPPSATGRGLFSLLLPGFPTVPQFSTIDPLFYNRTWCVKLCDTPFEFSTGAFHSRCYDHPPSCVGYVHLACFLTAIPLCAVRITRFHRSYQGSMISRPVSPVIP